MVAIAKYTFGFLSSIFAEVQFLAQRHFQSTVPAIATFFVAHILVQYFLPYLRPEIYDVLGIGKYGASPSDHDRKTLAKHTRTKVIASAMAMWVCCLALGVVASPEGHALGKDVYGSTPTSEHLVRISIAYFVWDVSVCFLDGEPFEYWLHGGCCLLVYVCASRPFLHYLLINTLLFEASTPFLHMRVLLIEMGLTGGALYGRVQAAFGALFFLTRIVNGYKLFLRGWAACEALMASGTAHNVPVLRMYQALCLALSILNTYWMVLIVLKALGHRKVKGAAESKSASPSVCKADKSKTA